VFLLILIFLLGFEVYTIYLTLPIATEEITSDDKLKDIPYEILAVCG
jgi:hypothetical protein